MEAAVEVGLPQGCLSWFGGAAWPSAWPVSLATNGACETIPVVWASGIMNSGFRTFQTSSSEGGEGKSGFQKE